jgi:hypothetical protein
MKILTGAVPFSDCSVVTSVTHIIDGRRPPRPTHSALTDNLWATMQDCWNQMPHFRPKMSEVLQTVPGFVSKQFRRHELSKSSPEFQLALGRFYGGTEYENCITHLRGAALDEFINFLDDVGGQTFVAYFIRSRILTKCPGTKYPRATPGTIRQNVE